MRSWRSRMPCISMRHASGGVPLSIVLVHVGSKQAQVRTVPAARVRPAANTGHVTILV